MKGLRDAAASWIEVARIAARAWPAGAAWAVFVYPVSMLAAPFGAIAVGRVVDAIVGGRTGPAAVWLASFVAASAIAEIVTLADDEYVSEKLAATVEQALDVDLMRASLRTPGLEHLEDPRYADTLKTIASAPGRFGILAWYVRSAVGNLAGLLVAVLALAAVHPLLALTPAVAAGVGALRLRTAEQRFALREQNAALMRSANVYDELCMQPAAAKELRMLGLVDWAVGRFADITGRARRAQVRSALIDVQSSATRSVARGAVLAAGTAWIVWLASRGRASAGDVAMGLGLLQSVFDQTHRITYGAAGLADFALITRAYRSVTQHRSAVSVTENARPAPDLLGDGIRFDDVSFAYPGTDRLVLRNVSLHIAAGTTVALVGDNGAGKTTLVKLLCRFYDPVSGRITVDGIDLRELDLDGWRRSMTAAFQDFAQYAFTVRETIGVGDLVRLADDASVTAAAARGGGDAVVADAGLERQLGAQFPGGTDLSAGEWQKLALSRAAMRADAALLTILDEPTAALDPRAEHDVFETFSALARSGRSRGAITLLISHRFSTVRMADVIVVLQGGRVVEHGVHDELLARRGVYAELYDLQARQYS